MGRADDHRWRLFWLAGVAKRMIKQMAGSPSRFVRANYLCIDPVFTDDPGKLNMVFLLTARGLRDPGHLCGLAG